MRIVRARVTGFRLPLRSPIGTALGVVEYRDGVLLELEGESGSCGWGEATPYPGFTPESVDGVRSELVGLAGRIVERGADEALSALRCATARSAAATALEDLRAREQGISLAELQLQRMQHEGSPLDSVPVNALLAGGDPESVAERARQALADGYTCLKLKVGADDLALDEARVAAARMALGEAPSLRLDANQAWSEEVAREALERFSAYRIEYVEQPVAAAAVDALARLRERSPIPIAADEAAGDCSSIRALIDAHAADVLVIKPSLAGGPTAVWEIAEMARRAKIGVVLTSLLDGAIAVAAALQLAAAWGAIVASMPACGLATHSLLARDLAALPQPRDGFLPLPQGVGIGVEPDRDALAALAVGEAFEARA